MPAALRLTDQTETGIGVLGRMPWSTHFSLYYETPSDLLDVVVPFFKAGLEAGELCIWLSSEPSLLGKAESALRTAVPHFAAHLAKRDIEFGSAKEWYTSDGRVEVDELFAKWSEMNARASREGYAGLRASGDLGWMGANDWAGISEYEASLHRFLPSRRIVVMCTYPLANRTAADLLDSVRAHHFAIARRNGAVELIETASLKNAKQQIQQRNEELERHVAERTRELARVQAYLEEGQRLNHSGSFAYDPATREYTYLSPQAYEIFGFDPAARVTRDGMLALIHPDDRPRVERKYVQLSRDHGVDVEFRITRADGRTRHIYTICHPIFDADGKIVEVVGTDIDITERKRAAARLARVKRAARERALEERFGAALEERTRLAREIHDSLLQGVTGIALQLRATLPHLKGASAAAIESIRAVVELAETTIRDARRAVWDMRAPSLVQKGLPDALEESVRRTAATGSVTPDFAIVGKPRALPPQAEDTIFRVGQEAVLNAVKHAEARRVTVRLVYEPRSATLTVTDDGKGFKVDPAPRTYSGRWGLLGMRERSERIGAALTVRSTPSRGTIVSLKVPIAPKPRR
ncbi:MAG TPA: MEDS domain-containing protein [Gemmatimonadaceae bacterium]|nr:MEDS domain-containing protein [Gemmatimonadaceae bacterium]